MAAAAILDFVGSQIWRYACFRDVIWSHRAKLRANMCKSGRVTAVKAKFQNGGCPPSWIIICYAGQPTKTTWRPEACVQISYQSKEYFWRYRHLKISQIWLKTPIPAPKIFVFGGFDPKHHFSASRPQKALPWPKTRFQPSHVAVGPAARPGRWVKNTKRVETNIYIISPIIMNSNQTTMKCIADALRALR